MKSKRILIVQSDEGQKEFKLEYFGHYTQIYSGYDQAVVDGRVTKLEKQFPVVRPVIVASDPATGEIVNLEPDKVRFKV